MKIICVYTQTPHPLLLVHAHTCMYIHRYIHAFLIGERCLLHQPLRASPPGAWHPTPHQLKINQLRLSQGQLLVHTKLPPGITMCTNRAYIRVCCVPAAQETMLARCQGAVGSFYHFPARANKQRREFRTATTKALMHYDRRAYVFC